MADNIDIMKNVKAIEILKADLLKDLALLYEGMAAGPGEGEDILNALSGIGLNAYILSRRLGIDYPQLDEQMRNKLKVIAAKKPEDFEEVAGLLKYLNSRGQKDE